MASPHGLAGKWIGYVRVSTDEQARDNMSLPTQERTIRRWASERPGIELLPFVVGAGESAYKADRPSLGQLVAAVRKEGARGVIVVRANRFAREWRKAGDVVSELVALQVSLRSVLEPDIDETPEGVRRLGEAILHGQRESDEKRTLALAYMRPRAEAGRFLWQAPIGYKGNGKVIPSLIPDPERADSIRELFDRTAKGHLLADVVESLNRRGFNTGRGKPLTLQTASRIIKNPAYVGRLVVEKWEIDVHGDWEPLVSDAMARAALSSLARRHRGKPTRRPTEAQ